MNSTKCPHELQKENSRDEQGAWKDRVPDWSSADQLWFRCATLISKGRIHKLQSLRPGHEDPGESELPSEW